MKRILILIIISISGFLFCTCSKTGQDSDSIKKNESISEEKLSEYKPNAEKEVIVQRYSDGSKKKIVGYNGEEEKTQKVYETEYYNSGQIKSNIFFKDEQFCGTGTRWYKNGKKEREGEFINGKLTGEWLFWHKNGTLKKRTGFKAGLQHGKYKVWYDNKQIKQAGEYEHGHLAGKITEWYKNGKKKVTAVYKDGKPNGKYTEWYDNGRKKKENDYKAGRIHNKYMLWYVNGEKEQETDYVEGKRHGKFTTWYNNSQKKQEGIFNFNKPAGKFKEWYRNGAKRLKVDYKDGAVHGKYIEWYDNGQKKTESEYKYGESEGPFRKWHENGNKFTQQDYSKYMLERVREIPAKNLSSYSFDPESAVIDSLFKRGNKTGNSAFKTKFFSLNAKNMSFEPDLSGRIKRTPDFLIKHWENIDNRKNYSDYTPDKNEMKIIRESLNNLPELHKKVLKEKLIGIYFINNLLGSGLAGYVIDDNKDLYAYLLFNPETLKENISDWLTQKENTCFIQDNPDIKILVDCGKKYSGFLPILLHESTHIVDYIKCITPYLDEETKMIKMISTKETDFTRGIWKSYKEPVKENDFPLRKQVTFYGMMNGPRINISDSLKLYKDFRKTPFVSLYSSQKWIEDLAEYFTFYHLTQVLKQPYKISVYDKDNLIFSYEPMKSSKVQSRFPVIKKLY